MEAGSSPSPSAAPSTGARTAARTVTLYDQRPGAIPPTADHPLVALLDDALRLLGIHGVDLDLTLTGVEAMAALNREHMGSDGPTDVLAFPLDAPDRLDAPVGLVERGGELVVTHHWHVPDGPPAMLGDLVVCPQVAAAQAQAAGHSVEAELALLCVHGLLHLLGHDHAQPDERADMFGLTDVLLDRCAATVVGPTVAP